MKNPSVLLIGNIGATNTGDEAILEGILTVLQKHFPTWTPYVFSAQPEETERMYHEYNVQAFHFVPAGIKSTLLHSKDIFKALPTLKNVECVFLGGGGLFTDVPSLYAPFLWTVQSLFVLYILRKPLHILAQSVGPLKTSLGRSMTKYVYKRATSISVRDTTSQELLMHLLPERAQDIHLLTDPALCINYHTTKETKKHWESLDAHPKFEEEIEHEDQKEEKTPHIQVAVSLRPWEDTSLITTAFIEACRDIHIHTPLHLHLFPMQFEKEEDVHILEGVQRLCKSAHIPSTLHMLHSPKEVVKHLSTMDTAFGMRLHFLILSFVAGIPFIAVPYSSKITGLLKDLSKNDSLLPCPPTPEEVKVAIEKAIKEKKHSRDTSAFMSEQHEKIRSFMHRALSTPSKEDL